MVTNLGVIERVLRFVLGIALLAWAHGSFGAPLTGRAGWVVFAGGVFLTFTGVFRFCPFYAVMDIDTCAVREKSEKTSKRRL